MAERRAERRAAGATSEEPDFLKFNDLASEELGGKVIFATDEWFAPAANLLKRDAPKFVASAFTEFGKWMDGWETRRKRIPGHDWCIIQLGVPGQIHGFDIDTSFFTGNHSPFASIQAACLEALPTFTSEGDRTGFAASDSQLAEVAKLGSEKWSELVCVSKLNPGYSDCCHNYFKVDLGPRVTHIRLNMYPDGGIARLRVFGVGQRDWSRVPAHQEVDLLALANGTVCVGFSDAHFGHPRNMIGPGQAANMADGWETARRLDRPKKLTVDQRGILQVPGREWAVFRLGQPGIISSIEVDTSHFKGNFPDSCSLEVCTLTPQQESLCRDTDWNSGKWQLLLPPQKLRPHHTHRFHMEVKKLSNLITHIRFTIAPDGGVSRLRLWGQAAPMSTASPNQQRPTSKL